MSFVNFSNHNSQLWSESQYQEASKYGEIVDVKFPVVSPSDTAEEIYELAKAYAEKIQAMKPSVVMCQGEYCMVYATVSLLKKMGIPCVAACSERKSREFVMEDGSIRKESEFVFHQFREYI